MTSPTQLSLKKLREEGWPLVQVVEHWVPGVNIRRDLFGFIDILAVNGDMSLPILAVQATSTPNMSTRIKKITQEHPVYLQHLLKAGFAVEVWGWAKRGKPARWTLKTVEIGPQQ